MRFLLHPTGRLFLLLAISLLLWPARPTAHDVPSDIRIQAFLRPEGQRVRLMVRLPLAAMNDVAWPTDGPMLRIADTRPLLGEGVMEWVADRIDLFEGSRLLDRPTVAAVRLSLPSDTSFDTYEHALAHVTGGDLPDDEEISRDQVLVDVLFEYRIESDQSLFSIDPRFQLLGLRTLTVFRFTTPSGVERAFQFHDDPGLVRLDPRWFQAAARFVVEGFFHILGGIDHLLFLFCLVIPFRRVRGLLPIVTSFTVAHSITLIAAAYGVVPDTLWFPPLVETLIAVSIVYMALENIVVERPRQRWLLTFAFGLVHGFGFSFALRETLQFAGAHLVTSLLSFNVGVELGQIAVLIVLVPALVLLFRFAVAERVGTIILSALVVHTAWHWMVERGSQLWLYQYQWPLFDAAFFASLMRGLIVMVIAAAAAWVISLTLGQWTRSERA